MTFDIKKRRKELGLTLEQIGQHTQVSKSTVSKWEKGTIKNMGIDKAKLLAQILQVDIAVLLGYEQKIGKKRTHIHSDEEAGSGVFSERRNKHMIMYEKDGRAVYEAFSKEDYEYILRTIELLKNKDKNQAL